MFPLEKYLIFIVLTKMGLRVGNLTLPDEKGLLNLKSSF